MRKTTALVLAFAGLLVLPFPVNAQSSDVDAQRRSKIKKCFEKLVEKALENPDLTPIPDKVSVPLGLGTTYLTRQATFEDADGQHGIAVNSADRERLLFIRLLGRSGRVFVTSRTGDFISGVAIEQGVVTRRTDVDFRLLGESEVRFFLTHAYPSGNCTAAYFPRH